MYQGIRIHKKGFQAIANVSRDENDVVADHKIILRGGQNILVIECP